MPHKLTSGELLELSNLRVEVETLKMQSRADGNTWLQAWRARERWDGRWHRTMSTVLRGAQPSSVVPSLVKDARAAWGVGRLRKASSSESPPPNSVLMPSLEGAIAYDQFQQNAMAAYIGISIDEAEDAGQFTLDALGVDKTFSWASPRNFAGDPFAVRGSKVLQSIYGTHLARLAAIVIDATNPAHPSTHGQLVKRIRAEWPILAAKHARTIARTESASVWETTNFNTLKLNGVQQLDWLIGHGPSIGPPKSYPVCERCLEKAARSPWDIDALTELPPLHPNCRCTTIQHDDPNWLPPAEPWTGSEAPMETFV